MKLMMSDWKVELVNDNISEFNVLFKGPLESALPWLVAARCQMINMRGQTAATMSWSRSCPERTPFISKPSIACQSIGRMRSHARCCPLLHCLWMRKSRGRDRYVVCRAACSAATNRMATLPVPLTFVAPAHPSRCMQIHLRRVLPQSHSQQPAEAPTRNLLPHRSVRRRLLARARGAARRVPLQIAVHRIHQPDLPSERRRDVS